MAAALESIAAQVQRVLEGQAEITGQLDAIGGMLAAAREGGRQRDRHLRALTSIALRYAREPPDWAGLRRELHELGERVTALERGAR